MNYQKSIYHFCLSDCNGTRTHNHLVRKGTLNHLIKLAFFFFYFFYFFLNDRAVLRVLICAVHLTVSSYHVTCAFQIESALCSCLSVKELLARNRRDIWSLSDCNVTRTHNHLVRKRTLNHLFIYLFMGPPALAGRVLWNRACPSFCLSGHFLGIVSLVCSKFWHDARNPYVVVRDRALFSRKNFFAPKIGKMGQKWAKNRVFLNILKNLVINLYWIWSIMKMYIICYAPAQIPYLGKILVPEMWAKMFSVNQIAGFFNHSYLWNKSME